MNHYQQFVTERNSEKIVVPKKPKVVEKKQVTPVTAAGLLGRLSPKIKRDPLVSNDSSRNSLITDDDSPEKIPTKLQRQCSIEDQAPRQLSAAKQQARKLGIGSF